MRTSALFDAKTSEFSKFMVPESEAAFILPATDKSTLLAGHSEKTAKVIKVCCTYGSYF